VIVMGHDRVTDPPAGAYALYSGLVVIAVTGLLLGPGVHALMHRVHWDESD
jgi:hypothetical protein